MEKKEEKKPRKKAALIIQNTLLIIAVCVLLFSGWKLFSIYSEYNEGKSEYDTLVEFMQGAVTPSVPVVADDNSAEVTETDNSQQLKELALLFDELEEQNSDVFAWIKIPDTIVDYPVVQTSDNDYYLTHTFLGTKNSSGTIFADTVITDKLDAQNLIIYGHNMNNGSMFAELMQYYKQGQSYYDEHPDIYLYTRAGIFRYRIFSAFQTTPDNLVYTYAFADEDTFIDYIQRSLNQSCVNTDLPDDFEFDAGSHIITLSTCTNVGDGRFVVQAVLME